ncbi:copper resistance protein CopC [Geodermatophilus sp. SYSU D00691]
MSGAALVRRSALLVVAVLAVLLGGATSARAHTELAASTPADGGTVTGPLPAVELTFSGAVLTRQVTVRGPDGADVTTGPASVAGAVLTQPVSLGAAGTYTVDYGVTSSDGHDVDGSLTFTYAPPATSAAPSPTPETTPEPAAPSPAAPSEAAAESDPGGLPAWLLVGGAAVLVGAVLLIPWRRRSRGRAGGSR